MPLLTEAESFAGLADPHLVQALREAVDSALMMCATQARLCLLYTSPSPRDRTRSRMPSSA